MRPYSIILTLFLCSLNLFGQQKEFKYDYKQGYNFIKKAKLNLKKGQLEKTEEYISKAKASDYGFCGNAWAGAYSQINMIEVQILNQKKNYDKALTILDSLEGCSFGADCSMRDSLKIATLCLKFGNEKVKEAFKKVNTVNNYDDFYFEADYWVNVADLNYNFHFKGGRPVYVNGRKVEPEKSGNQFYDLAKNQTFYKLIE